MALIAGTFILLSSYGAGRGSATLLHLRLPQGLRGRATAFALGFSLLALLAFALGRVGRLDAALLGAVALITALPGALFLVSDVPWLHEAWRRAGGERWLLVATSAIAVGAAVLASAPPTSADATSYHLTAPKLWISAGRIFDIWWSWETFQPFAVQMHYVYAHALAGGAAAMVVGAGLSAFSAVCIFGLGRALASPRVGAIAALLWVGQGIFLWEATGAFVEFTTTAFVVLAAWHLAELARSGRLPDAAWAGLAAGLAAGTKYIGLVTVPWLGAIAFALAGPVRRRRFLALGAFAVPLAVAVPWYAKNWLVTGDPFYPVLAGALEAKEWGPGDELVMAGLQSSYGVEGLWRLPLIPLEFVLHTDRFERGYSFSPMFALAPLALVWARRWAWLFAASFLAYTLVWFEVMRQLTRFWLPALAFAAVLAAFAWTMLWRRSARTRAVAGAVAGISAIAFAAMSWLFAWRIAPGALGLETEHAHVQRLTGLDSAFDWIDRNLPGEGRVLVGVRETYWLDRPYIRFASPLFTPHDPSRQVIARLRAYDVRYLAFFEGEFERGVPPPIAPIRPQLELLARLPVPYVRSRTLGRVEERTLAVYRWRR